MKCSITITRKTPLRVTAVASTRKAAKAAAAKAILKKIAE